MSTVNRTDDADVVRATLNALARIATAIETEARTVPDEPIRSGPEDIAAHIRETVASRQS